SKCEPLSLICSRLGIEHKHCVRELPLSPRLFEVWLVILQIRIDANGKDQRRGFTMVHSKAHSNSLLCTGCHRETHNLGSQPRTRASVRTAPVQCQATIVDLIGPPEFHRLLRASGPPRQVPSRSGSECSQ